MYLFFDTETTGLPLKYNAPADDFNNWPRMIQIAWLLCDEQGKRLETKEYIIKPEDFIIPKEASNVHGISTEKALKKGVGLKKVLKEFNVLIEKCDFMVAHNIYFDRKILEVEFLRMEIATELREKEKLCTMMKSTKYCALPGARGYKWPKLSELHIKLFGKNFEGAHDALADIQATEKCFWKMRELGLI